MSDEESKIGTIAWTDLTIENAGEIGDFYAKVIGWKPSPVDMDGYNDFTMNLPGSGRPIAGVCHARGGNSDLPAQWLNYIVVKDVEASISACLELGGTVVSGPKNYGDRGRYCVIRDPAGAVIALYSEG